MSLKQSFYLLVLSLLFACETETIKVDGEVIGKEYYPINIGNTWVYKYDSIVYDESLGRIDSASGYIRELIVRMLDESRFVIQRSWKKELSSSWTETDRWTLIVEEERIIKVEENLPFIKLVFPLIIGQTWDGNSLFEESITITVAGESLIPYFNWNYEVIADDLNYIQQNISADRVVQIVQVSDSTNIELRRSEEFFAPNIGLVEKNLTILDCNCFGVDSSIPWEQKAEKGFILKQRLINYSVQ